MTGYSRARIYELVRSYKAFEFDCLGDLRRDNPGASALLDDVEQANLLEAIRGLAPDGGLVRNVVFEVFDGI